jgi:hypothetical protein
MLLFWKIVLWKWRAMLPIHANMPIIEVGQTKLITNQLGYCAYGEIKGFSWKGIEV